MSHFRAVFRPLAVSVGVALSAVLLSGCLADAAPAQSDGGILRVALDGDPRCVDPSQGTLIVNSAIGRQVVDSLVDQDPETGEFSPWLAESWVISDDATEYTFTIREGVTFSDGDLLNAEAVKGYFEYLLADPAKTSIGAAYLGGLESIVVDGDNSVTVTFTEPNAAFLAGTASRTLGILSPASIATPYEDRCQGIGVIGSGPFTLDEYVANESVSLSARADYDWPSDLSTHTGAAYLTTIEFSVLPEASVRSGAVSSGQVDIATAIQSQDEEILQASGATVESSVNPGVQLLITPNLAYSQKLHDPNVRRAVQLAIDGTEIANVVLSPSFGIPKGLLSDTTPGYSDFSDLLGPDLDEANRLLDAAGWELASDGIRVKDGEPLSLSVVYFFQANVYDQLQLQLREVGIDLQLNYVTAEEFTSEIQKGQFDLRQSQFSRADPDILRTVFDTRLSNSIHLEAADPEAQSLDVLLAEQRAIADESLRHEKVDEIQRYILERDWAFPLAQVVQVVATTEGVEGFRFSSSSVIALYDVRLVS